VDFLSATLRRSALDARPVWKLCGSSMEYLFLGCQDFENSRQTRELQHL
jgi:hypothetical protein